MNTYAISLTSSSTSTTEIRPLLDVEDYSKLSITLEGITEKITPSYVRINWGDGVDETFDKNDIYTLDRTKINALKFNPILSETYSHEYYPSETALLKHLSAQVLIMYANNTYSWFVQPLRIRTYEYFESVGDLALLNANIRPTVFDTREYQLKCATGNTLVELTSK